MGSSGGSGGTTSPLTTKGDVWGFSTVNARVPVGSDGQVLTSRASASPGVDWETPTTSAFSALSLMAIASGSEQALTQNVFLQVNLQAINDPSGSLSGNNYVCSKAGYYLVVGQVGFDVSTNAIVSLTARILQGGSAAQDYRCNNANGGGTNLNQFPAFNVSGIFKCAVSDTIGLYAQTNSNLGGQHVNNGDPHQTYLAVAYLGS